MSTSMYFLFSGAPAKGPIKSEAISAFTCFGVLIFPDMRLYFYWSDVLSCSLPVLTHFRTCPNLSINLWPPDLVYGVPHGVPARVSTVFIIEHCLPHV